MNQPESEKAKIEEYLSELDDTEIDVIIRELYRQNPEAFPTLDDVLSMAAQVEDAYGDEDDLEWPEALEPFCCEFCRKLEREQLG